MDIIFFAAIAFFILYKLNRQIGRIDEEEKKQIEARVAQNIEKISAIQEKIVQEITKTIEVQNQASDEILAALSPEVKESFSNILQRCNISAEFFVNGVKSAFEMVLKAFSSADLEILKTLLSEKIYQGFEAAIQARQDQQHSLTTNLIAIDKVEILTATLLDNMASVTAKITSRQINYIADKDGQMIVGKKDEINEMHDVWTFKKDVSSSNPNWAISNTAN